MIVFCPRAFSSVVEHVTDNDEVVGPIPTTRKRPILNSHMSESLDAQNQNEPLSFGEFKKKQNNFHLYFTGKPGEHMMGDLYREKEHFKKCLAENSEFSALVEGLYGQQFTEHTVENQTQEIALHQANPELEKKLYSAYVMMRPYVSKDWDLFQ